MKNIFFLTVFVLACSLNAQFSISGNIKGYANKSIFIKYIPFVQDKLLVKVTTDANGNFKTDSKIKYSGLIRFEFDNGSVVSLLTDNENLKFSAVYSEEMNKELKVEEGKTAKSYVNYIGNEEKISLINDVFPALKNVYGKNDEFYGAIDKEEKRLNNLKSSNDLNPLIHYYIETSNLYNEWSQSQDKTNADLMLNKLNSDPSYFETCGFINQFVYLYFRNSIADVKGETEVTNKIDETISTLISKNNLSTARGQNLLTAALTILPKDKFSTIFDKYLGMAAQQKKLSSDLLQMISGDKVLKVGNKAPNIVFNEKVKGYKSLYDIKTNKKILIFWASWCPHCQKEMPFVADFYRNYKKEGGEIVAFSLDVSPEEYANATKNYDWINYSDFLKWDSPAVIEYGILATPTIIVLDKDNKIVKIVDHISDAE